MYASSVVLGAGAAFVTPASSFFNDIAVPIMEKLKVRLCYQRWQSWESQNHLVSQPDHPVVQVCLAMVLHLERKNDTNTTHLPHHK